MSVIVTVSNEANLKKVKDFLGAKDENEAIDFAIEKILREFEMKEQTEETEEAEEEIDIDVHQLNRIPPKRTYEIEAEFVIVGRGMPLKYDLSDYDFTEYENED
jgi:hypothetical protein